jgi:hypothetical protein
MQLQNVGTLGLNVIISDLLNPHEISGSGIWSSLILIIDSLIDMIGFIENNNSFSLNDDLDFFRVTKNTPQQQQQQQ